MSKTPKIIVSDQTFKDFEEMGLTAEEQQELLDQIKAKVEDGSLFEDSRELTDEEVQELQDRGLLDFDVEEEELNRTIN